MVDLHAITVWQDPDGTAPQTREMAAALLACGLDPQRTSCSCSSLCGRMRGSPGSSTAWPALGWLNRMTQFKDKAGKDREAASAGLYVYPNLMAADILAYHATQVPVGDDQKQHLELANDIAQKFNHDYGVEFFPHDRAADPGPAARVMSLRDGTKKMSKSDASDQSRINLTDDRDAIALKIRRAKTDPEPLPEHRASKAGRRRATWSASGRRDRNRLPENVLREHGGKGFGAFKEVLAEALVDTALAHPGGDAAAAGRPGGARRGAAAGRAAGRGDRRADRHRGGAAGRLPAAVGAARRPERHWAQRAGWARSCGRRSGGVPCRRLSPAVAAGPPARSQCSQATGISAATTSGRPRPPGLPRWPPGDRPRRRRQNTGGDRSRVMQHMAGTP